MSNRKLNTQALPVLLALLVSAGDPAVAIEDGRPDRWNRNVGFLGFDVDGPAAPTPPFALCSGFVISHWAFVTAAHCIAAIPPELAQSWAVTLESGSPQEPIVPPGVFSQITFNVTDFPILVETVSATAVHLHPEFDPATAANDVAILNSRPARSPCAPFGWRSCITWTCCRKKDCLLASLCSSPATALMKISATGNSRYRGIANGDSAPQRLSRINA